MKKTEVKGNAKVTSVIALILATSVVIGILSSSAMKLVASTYLMQVSKNVSNVSFNEDSLEDKEEDEKKDEPTDNTPAPDTQAPDADVPADPGDSGDSGDSGSSGGGIGDIIGGLIGSLGDLDLGGLLDDLRGMLDGIVPDGGDDEPETPDEPSTPDEPTDSEVAELEANQAALKSYNDVLTRNKASGHRPGFRKTTVRTLSKDFFASLWFSSVEEKEAIVKYLEGSLVEVSKGTLSADLCINNEKYASVLDHNDAAAVGEAVKSSQKIEVTMGLVKHKESGAIVHAYDINKATGEISYAEGYKAEDYVKYAEYDAVRVIINFNDEVNPQPLDENGKTDSFIASVFPVVTAEEARAAIGAGGVTDVTVTYKDCAVDMYYDSTNGNIILLNQYINYDVAVKDGIVVSTGTVSEVNVYDMFKY